MIMFCAVHNLPLRGHREKVGKMNSGVFLGLADLIGRYSPVMAAHLQRSIENPRSVNYLSHSIQNEFVNILGSTVRQEIIKSIEKAKYFSILLDCTPDISHKEQM